MVSVLPQKNKYFKFDPPPKKITGAQKKKKDNTIFVFVFDFLQLQFLFS